MLNFAEIAAAATSESRRRLAELAGRTAVRRSHQHPVHQRHHRQSQGRHPHPPQHPQQRLLHRRGHAALGAGPALHSRALLSLLRHGAGQSGLRHPSRLHGGARRRLRSLGGAGDGGRRALHRPAWRADHVHRHPRSSPFRRVRSLEPAHRHHGRQPLPHRGDEALHREDAYARDHHRLWHDRDQPGQLPELDRRSHRAAGLHRRPHPAPSRGQDRRRLGPHPAAGHAGRAA